MRGYESAGFVRWVLEVKAYGIGSAMEKFVGEHPELLGDPRIVKVTIERDRP